jgi:two-component sensor histidine kinase
MTSPQQNASRDARSTAALRPSVMLDEKLLEFVPGAVYVCDLDGVVVRYNKRAGELWGRYPVPGDPNELYCGSHKLYRATGEVMPHNETPMVDALREGNSYRNLEVQVEQPSGKLIWILVNIDPLRDDAGEIVGVINCFQDITDRKLADMRQQLLVNELNHRVKNTLATVQSIAAFSFREGAGPDERKWFESRLMALSRAHDVLTQEKWEGAELHDLVTEVAAPSCGSTPGRISFDGPTVYLKPQLALTMAIALHELCTNAAKYGALSNNEGKVGIDWALSGEGTLRILRLNWIETGGPPVFEPQRRGFGTRIIERSLTREHKAKVSLDFARSGFRCDLEVPLP